MDPRSKYPELQRMEWNVIESQVAFDTLDAGHCVSATGEEHNVYPMGACVCVGCKGVSPLLMCTNCRSKLLHPGIDTNGVTGLFCVSCDRGFTDWTCGGCGTTNPIRRSLGTYRRSSFPVAIGCLVVVALVVGAVVLFWRCGG